MIIVLGILANICYITCGVFKRPVHAMMMGVAGNICYIFYYTLIGLYEPIINIALGTVCGLILIKSQNIKTIATASLITAACITALQMAQLSTYYGLILIAACWVLAIADIYKYNYIVYKSFVIVSQSLWVIFCIKFNDYAMLATCVFIIGTNLGSLIYYTYTDRGLGVPWRARFALTFNYSDHRHSAIFRPCNMRKNTI